MKAVDFDSANVVFKAAGYADLPAERDDVPSITTRWVPTPAERQAIADGGAIVLRVIGTNPQPVSIGVIIDEQLVEE
jgi:hypothetical protein